MKKKIWLVTGYSTGFGRALVKVPAARGDTAIPFSLGGFPNSFLGILTTKPSPACRANPKPAVRSEQMIRRFFSYR